MRGFIDDFLDFLTVISVIMLFLSISAIDSNSKIPFVILFVSLAWICIYFVFVRESR